MVGNSRLIKDLPNARQLLAGEGLIFRVGPFTIRATCPFPTLRDEILAIYGGYPVGRPSDFVDYHVNVGPGTTIRRWFRPNVIAEAGMVNAPFVPLPLDIGVLALEMALNWLVATTADRYLIFHSGVVARNGKAVLMPGASGIGKSTLTSGLAFAGWRLFSDEFGLFDPDKTLFYPYPRPISLKNASTTVMADRLPTAVFSRPFYNTPKGTIRYLCPEPEAIAQMAEPAAPTIILFPEYNPTAEAQAIELRKPEMFAMIRSSSVNCDRMAEVGFKAMTDMTETYRGFRIIYRSLDQGIHMVNDLVEQWGV